MDIPQKLKYKDLSTTHPDFDQEQIKKLCLLYQGGKNLKENAKLFLTKEPFESPAQYNSRLQAVSYKNYLSQIINDYTSELFSKNLSLTSDEYLSPIYEEFWYKTDKSDKSILHFMEEIFHEAVLYGKSYFGLDLPKSDQEFTSLAEEEASLEAIPYLFNISPLSVINWKKDEHGKYQFLVLQNEEIIQENPFSSERYTLCTFKIWFKENEQVHYAIYQGKTKKQFKAQDEFQLTDQGTVSFQQIPIFCLDIDRHLCIGSLIGELCQDLLKKESALNFAMQRSLFAIPVYKQGPELPDDNSISEISQNPHRGQSTAQRMRQNGFAVIGPNDDLSFVEPSGQSFEINQQKIEHLTNEIYRIVNQMSHSIQSSQANYRAALSKQLDQRSKQLILETYAHLIKKTIKKVISTIAEARGDKFEFQIHGMNDYQNTSRDILIQEAQSISQIFIPSKTFKVKYLAKLANSLFEDFLPEEKEQIEQEILQNLQENQTINPKNDPQDNQN